MPKNVCILENSFIINEGIKHIVSGLNDFSIKGNFETFVELENNKALIDCGLLICNPDLIKNIQSITRLKIKNPTLKILVIDQEKNPFKKIFTPASVDGYIFLCCHTEEVLKALLAVAYGEKFFCNKVLNHFIEPKNNLQSCNPVNLSERELEVLKLISKGYSSKEISNELTLSFHTVTTHRKNIARKLKVKKTGELVAAAHKLKII